MKKIVILLITVIFLSIFFCNFASATEIGSGDFKINIQDPDTPYKEAKPDKVIQTVFNITITISQIVFIILFLVAGIMYLTSAGNEDQTVKARKLMLDAVIGIIIVLASWAIGNWIIKELTGNSIETGTSGGGSTSGPILTPAGFPTINTEPETEVTIEGEIGSKEKCLSQCATEYAQGIDSCNKNPETETQKYNCMVTANQKNASCISDCNRLFK